MFDILLRTRYVMRTETREVGNGIKAMRSEQNWSGQGKKKIILQN